VFSQNKEDRALIKKESNVDVLLKLKNQHNNKHQKMLEKAEKIGFNKNYFSKNGSNKTLNEIINGIPYFDEDDNENAAITNRVDKIWQGGSSNLNLSGKGVIIGHWEASGTALSTHVELTGNVTILEATSVSSHATHTAGTMIGKGVNPDARGMASDAIIYARRSNNDESEMADFAMDGGIISNHSYGSSNPNGNILEYGYYSSHAQDWDEISYHAPFYLIVKSAGNERNDNYNISDGGYDILFTQATAKNILVVGAVKDVLNYTSPSSVQQTNFSSYGPTDDWRIKPDIVANGEGLISSNSASSTAYQTKSGTSMAAPTVTGTIALLQEHYHNINDVYMKSATVKALIINATDEVGENQGPDFGNGWGLINAERSAEIISNNSTSSLILEDSLENNQEYQFTITVDGSKPLALTMAWTDVAAIAIAANSVDQSDLRLINDLDIRIVGTENTYLPWIIETGSFTNAATKGDNFRDNVEKIEVDNIPAGTYTVKVTHKGQLFNDVNQGFSIVVNNLSSYSLSVDNSFLNKVEVYPNPVLNNKIFINLNQSSDANTEVLLLDITGRQVLKQNYKNTEKIELVTPTTLSGLYLLRINTSKGSFTQKIIIN
jgi:hypothetical protein